MFTYIFIYYTVRRADIYVLCKALCSWESATEARAGIAGMRVKPLHTSKVYGVRYTTTNNNNNNNNITYKAKPKCISIQIHICPVYKHALAHFVPCVPFSRCKFAYIHNWWENLISLSLLYNFLNNNLSLVSENKFLFIL